jgi:tetratricopeptide (TPR) repeat protein
LLYAYAGRHEDATATIESAPQTLLEPFQRTHDAMNIGWIAMLRGHPETAEPELRSAAEALSEVGGSEHARVAAILAELLYQLGRDQEAEDWTRRSEVATLPGQIMSQAQWRSTRAKVLAHRGEANGAVRLAVEAVEWARKSDGLPLLGDCLLSRGEVLLTLRRVDEASTAFGEALAVYQRKNIRPSIERTNARLAQLRAEQR